MVAMRNILQSVLWTSTALVEPESKSKGEEPGFDYDSLSLREVGSRNTLDWRAWLEKDGNPISPWHDIPLYPDESKDRVISFVVEIPRWSNGKVELNRAEPLNPFFHDEVDEEPRFVENIWPHVSYPFHYGSIPQTWEDPNLDHDFTGLPGDNDPVDLFDISEKPSFTGQIKKVKILGGFALADGDETDWKTMGIDIEDPLARYVNDVNDLKKYRPELAKAFFEWFKYYKVARGDDIIKIIGEEYKSAKFMAKTIQESHGFWKDLIRGESDSNEVNYNQTSIKKIHDSYVRSEDATDLFDTPEKSNVLPPTEKPERYRQWFYLDKKHRLIELPDEV